MNISKLSPLSAIQAERRALDHLITFESRKGSVDARDLAELKFGWREQMHGIFFSRDTNGRRLSRRSRPHHAVRVSLTTCRPAVKKRPVSGWQQACAIAISDALDETAVERIEAGFVQRREQFGRMAALKESTSNNECEIEWRWEFELQLGGCQAKKHFK
jgi:hypothetical protein